MNGYRFKGVGNGGSNYISFFFFGGGGGGGGGLYYSLSDLSCADRFFHVLCQRSSVSSKLGILLWSTTACMYKHNVCLNSAKC